jgi:two-component system chemotaxis response regulator CheY
MAQAHAIRPSPFPKAPPVNLVPVVLVVDDECTLLEIFSDTLEDDGLRVLTATNGQEALAIAETTVPDVLVTDVAMPRLDGFGLVRAVRRLYPSMPIIVISGDACYDDRLVEDVAAELGVATTLMKPFDLTALHRAVRSMIPAMDTTSSDTGP